MEALKKKYKLNPALLEEVVDKVYGEITRGVQKSPEKKCYVTVGQNGSGKSTYSQLLASLNPNLAAVNGDYIRSFHPYIRELMLTYPDEFGYIIYEDWSYIKDEVVRRLIKDGYNFTYESSGRDTNKAIHLIEALNAEGYSVKVSVIALSYLESRIRVLERFFRQLLSEGVGRISDYGFQRNAFTQTEEFLNKLDMELVSEIDILDANFISYPIAKGAIQKKVLIEVVRLMYEVYGIDNLEDRFELIKIGAANFRHMMSDKLYERLCKQLEEIESLLGTSRK